MKKIYLVCTLALIGLLIFRGEDAILYSKQALQLCADMIIPSLLPFFICSGILIYSGFCQRLAGVFSPVMRPLFNVNPNGSAAFVLGLVSGYPLGAVTACQLYDSGYISKSETERLLSFCSNSGPLFILGSVGIGLYMGAQIGVLLYASHIASAVLVGVCMRFYGRGRHSAPDYKLNVPDLTFSEIFKKSAENAASSMLLICTTILFFSVSSRLVLDLVPFDIPPFVYGLFEFSGGNAFIAASDAPLYIRLIEASFVTGFAGLSVHMQVMAASAGRGLSLKPYFIGKLLHGALSAVLTLLLIKLTRAVPVFSPQSAALSLPAAFTFASVYAVIAVILICVISIFAYEKKRL